MRGVENGLDSWKSCRIMMSIEGAVVAREAHRGGFVESFVYREAARIRVMASEGTARRGAEGLRKMRTRGSIVAHRRKYARREASGKRAVVNGIEQPGLQELAHDCGFRIRIEAGAMRDAGIRVRDRVEGDGARMCVANFPRLPFQESERLIYHRRFARNGDCGRVAFAGMRLIGAPSDVMDRT